MSELKRCSRCVLPETHETILFDEEGICNVCRQIEYKQTKIDWEGRERELAKLLDQYRGKGSHDCIVPFSGGKDSTFILYTVAQRYKLKPLVVTFDHGFMRPTVLANAERTLKKLGVDYLKFRPNWKVVRRLMLEALIRKGDFCWHCHAGVYSYPMHVAVKFKIPLVIWGEPSAEYTSYYTYEDAVEVDERHFNRFINLGITAEDMQGMLGGEITMRDLEPFTYPALKDLKAFNYRSICLGSFIPWDTRRQSELIKRELGWQEEVVEGIPPQYGYEKIECFMQGVRDYLKYIKRGFGRTSHLVSKDIREGQSITREEALKLEAEYDGKRPASLDLFLEWVGLSEEEFMKIATSHTVSPYRHEAAVTPRGKPLWDQPLWDRTQPTE